MPEDRGLPQLVDLVDQHYELVYRVAYRLSGSAADAEDLTQQVFLTACRKLAQVQQPESLRAWLLTILRHAFLKTRTRGPFRTNVPFDDLPEPAAETLDDSPVDAEELQAALNELPVEFRTPLVLYYFEGLDYREIAARLQTPLGTVMSRLSRGKAHLRKRLSAGQPAGV